MNYQSAIMISYSTKNGAETDFDWFTLPKIQNQVRKHSTGKTGHEILKLNH